jgi:hypothetical protein
VWVISQLSAPNNFKMLNWRIQFPCWTVTLTIDAAIIFLQVFYVILKDIVIENIINNRGTMKINNENKFKWKDFREVNH